MIWIFKTIIFIKNFRKYNLILHLLRSYFLRAFRIFKSHAQCYDDSATDEHSSLTSNFCVKLDDQTEQI